MKFSHRHEHSVTQFCIFNSDCMCVL